MIQKKICLLGAFAVGKTALVQKFVHSIFSEKYLTTLGVKIDKKQMTVQDQDVNLMIWDLAGEDEFMSVRMSYLRGAAGYFLVADGTRPETLETAKALKDKVEAEVGALPFILLVNKADLTDEWLLEQDSIDDMQQQGWEVVVTSAKTGEHVETAFQSLAQYIVESQ